MCIKVHNDCRSEVRMAYKGRILLVYWFEENRVLK